jgi:hypothetical protein
MTVPKICVVALAIASLCYASHVSAAVVIYNETVDGDLPVTGSLPIMALDVGTNTVTGRIGTQTGFPFDFDSFAFSVPSGAQLISGSVAMTATPGNQAVDIANQWYLFTGSSNYEGGSLTEFFYVYAPGSYTFTSTPLLANVYNLSAEGASYSGSPPAFADYTFTFVVTSLAAVPEPATFVVWGLTLVGVAVCGKQFRELAS